MNRFRVTAPTLALILLSAVLISAASAWSQSVSAFPPSRSDAFSDAADSQASGLESLRALLVLPSPETLADVQTRFPLLLGEAAKKNVPQTLLGFLVVEAELKEGCHLYSPTQPPVPGGYPTKLDAVANENPSEKKTVTIGPFAAASEIKRVDFLDDVLEEMGGTAVFIAPIFSNSPSVPPDLEISGSIDALCCDDSTCNPLAKSFSFHFDNDYEVAPRLETAEKIASEQKKRSADHSVVSGAKSAEENHVAMESPAAEENQPTSIVSGRRSFWLDLFYAYLGGMILNVMPCVLPVIGLKIVSFFEQAGQSRSRAFRLNVWYSVGILSVFAILAAMSVGLSYLFTYGLFQIVMGGIVFAMALNLMGIWEISLPAFLGGRKSNELMRREGAFGAVFKGVITTLLAIPCGAPLLSPALVWADSMIKQGQSGSVLIVYLFIGFGMATPYLVIGAFPELLRFLPKPGVWMESFRNVMGFVLLTAVVWILFSMPPELVLPTIAFFFAIWFACWFLGRTPFDASKWVRWRRRMAAFLVVLVTILFSYNFRISTDGTTPEPMIPWTLENGVRGKMVRWAIRAERSGDLTQDHWALFDQKKLDAALAEKKPVLVDFTADWCANCKVLELTVLHTEEIEKLADQKGAVTLTADWTSRDKTPDGRDIGVLLRKYGGEQVPVLMIFTPGNSEPVILRGLFTRETLEKELNRLPDKKLNAAAPSPER